jgi:hypothetical protein
MLQSLFYLTTALHVLGVTTTQLQEHKTTVTTASGNRYTVLLSAAIVEELEFRIFHDSSRQQYGVTVTRCCSYSCFVLLKMGGGDGRKMLSDEINSVTYAFCWDLYIKILLRCTDP